MTHDWSSKIVVAQRKVIRSDKFSQFSTGWKEGTTMIEPTHYRFSVQWSPRDNEFVGTVAEFPSLSWLDSNEDDAFAGIRQLVADVVTEMRVSGQEPPVPFAEREYSGKLLLRIPPELHQRLATEAAENKVSLNRLISARLTTVGV